MFMKHWKKYLIKQWIFQKYKNKGLHADLYFAFCRSLPLITIKITPIKNKIAPKI